MGIDRSPLVASPSADEIVIYWSPGSCARVTLIALEEIGLSYEHCPVRRGDATAAADYARSVNPKGKVPALVVNGRLLTETPVIQLYLHRRFPEAGLLPEDDMRHLDALMMMSWFAAGLHPMINRSRFPMFTSTVPASFDSIRQIALDDLRGSFNQLEARLADGRDWLFEHWTIADAYLLWLWFRAIGSGITAAEFPQIDALARRCERRRSASHILDLEAKTYQQLNAAGHTIPNAPPPQAGWLPARD